MNRVEVKPTTDEFRAQIARAILDADHIASSDCYGVGIHIDADLAGHKAETLRYVLKVYDKHFG